jgi:hypothetical protein
MLFSLIPDKIPAVSAGCIAGASSIFARRWAALLGSATLVAILCLAGCATRQRASSASQVEGRIPADQAFSVVLVEGGWDAEQRYLSDSEWFAAREMILSALATAISNRPSSIATTLPAASPAASIYVFVAPPKSRTKYGPRDPCVGHVAIYRHPEGVYLARLEVATPREYVYFEDENCVQALARILGLARQSR